MKVAVIVDGYPILSQSFINRLIDDLSENDNLKIDIISIQPFDENKLRDFSSSNYLLFKNGRIKVRSLKWSSTPFKYVQYFFYFLNYLFKLVKSSSNIKYNLLSKVNLKYHIKAAILKAICGEQKYDVVHAQFLTIGIYTVLCNNVSPLGRIIATGRGSDVSNNTSLLPSEVKVLENDKCGVSKFLFVSKSLQEIGIDKGLSPSKCFVLYSGMDLSMMTFREPTIPSDEVDIKIIQVGRLVEKKGILLTLEVLKRIKNKINFHFTVVGEGDLLMEARSKAETMGLRDCIDFLGARNNKECLSLISSSDILVVPSLTGENGDSEGIPNVAKEAMAIGCIVVSSDHSGLKELVVDGFNGYLFTENNIDDFQSKLELAISNKVDWPIVAKRARENIEENFSIEVIGKKMLTLY